MAFCRVPGAQRTMIRTRRLRRPKRCRDGRGALPDFERIGAHARRGETLGVGADQGFLCPERLGKPHLEVRGTVVMVVEHREDLALPCEPSRLAVRELLL